VRRSSLDSRLLRRVLRAPRARVCEVHVAISPTPAFLSQIHLLAASLRRNGGALSDSRIVVTVSRDHDWFDIAERYPWARNYPIEWRWLDEDLFAQHGIFATALQRFTYAFDAPFVLMLDADILCTGPLDELLDFGHHALAGMVAHVAPIVAGPAYFAYVGPPPPDDEDLWDGLYASAGLGPPARPCQHTGWGLMDTTPERRYCPPYFNLGVLAATADVMTQLGRVVFDEMAAVSRYVDTIFRCQLAVTLAIERTHVSWRELPLRMNFPNNDEFFDAHPDDASDIRILHYMRGDQVDRWALASTQQELDAFLARTDLSPVNRVLQDAVRSLRAELVSGRPGGA
jgi:hypothetical protein